MSEERLMVLTMLQEGKISSDEASSLLQALDELEVGEENYNNDETVAVRIDNNNYYEKNMDLVDNISRKIDERTEKNISHKLNNKFEKHAEKMERTGEDFGERIENIGEKMGKVGEDFGERMGNIGENFGERMGKFGEELAESATSITEKVLNIVDNFLGKGSFDTFLGNYDTIYETMDKNISDMTLPSLEIYGTNGKIIMHSWDEENIRINAKCSVKKSVYDKGQSIYEKTDNNNSIIFKPRYTNGLGTSLEVFVPSNRFEKVLLVTTNGRIEVDGVNSKEFMIDTNNGSIKIHDLSSNKITASTNNGSIAIDDINSKLIDLNTSNASIIAKDVVCENIVATTKNGKISITDTESKDVTINSSNASIKVEDCVSSSISARTSNANIKILDVEASTINTYTSNSSIEICIDNNNKAFNIDAQTSMGRIDIEIPNLIYELNKQHNLGKQRILAHSASNINHEKQINIVASTANGSIKIN